MDSILGIHEAALTFRAQRMEVIATNLANADTPHYKARDVEFSSVLDGAANAMQMRTTDARHLSTAPRAAQSELKYRIPHQPSLDGNTVELSSEQTAFAENAVAYQTTLSFLNGRIGQITRALKGE